MGSLTVVAAIAVVIGIWVFKTRTARQSWLTKLDLVGTWVQDSDEHNSLEFYGQPDGGKFIANSPSGYETGTWQIAGSKLILHSQKNEEGLEYELVFFDQGVIGINGPSREKQVFHKRPDNVVKMPAQN